MNSPTRGLGRLAPLLEPKSIAVVGASDKGVTVRTKADLDRVGFVGPVYPVNPRRDEVWGGPCYPSLSALPETPDHVILNVPAAAIPQALTDAIAAGVGSVAIHASGFTEGGHGEGAGLAEEVRRIAAATDIPVSGGSFGGIFRHSVKAMTISLSRVEGERAGTVALVGQSGGMMMFTYEALFDRGIRANTVVASGSELVLSSADYVAALLEDDGTTVVGCFIESIKSLETFKDACLRARELGKHVVVLKAGASPEGRAAAMAHTGSVVGSLEAFEALARELGVICVHTTDEFVDALELASRVSHFPGARIGVVSHSGGLKDLIMDYCSELGITLPSYEQSTLDKAGELLGETGASLGNPLDTGFPGLTNPDLYARCVELVAADPNVDIILVQEELPRSTAKPREAVYLRQLNEQVRTGALHGKPVGTMSLASYSLTDHAREIRDELSDIFVLQEARRALKIVTAAGRAATLAPRAPARAPHPELVAIRARLESLRGPAPVTLSENDSKQLLAAYGVPVTNDRLASSADEAVKAADELGFPVVLKISGAALSHKSEIGGVLLDLQTEADVRAGWDQLAEAASRVAPEDAPQVLVSEFVSGGTELVLGLSHDSEVGPVLAIGSGGIAVEILDDVVVGLPPFTEQTAAELLGRTKAGKLVGGYRNTVRNVAAVHAAMVALGDLALDLSGLVAAVDINPLTVTATRATALDALVVLAPKA